MAIPTTNDVPLSTNLHTYPLHRRNLPGFTKQIFAMVSHLQKPFITPVKITQRCVLGFRALVETTERTLEVRSYEHHGRVTTILWLRDLSIGCVGR